MSGWPSGWKRHKFSRSGPELYVSCAVDNLTHLGEAREGSVGVASPGDERPDGSVHRIIPATPSGRQASPMSFERSLSSPGPRYRLPGGGDARWRGVQQKGPPRCGFGRILHALKFKFRRLFPSLAVRRTAGSDRGCSPRKDHHRRCPSLATCTPPISRLATHTAVSFYPCDTGPGSVGQRDPAADCR